MNKEILSLLPPKLLKIILKFKKHGYRWTGNYSTFEEALSDATGYESDDIIDKTIKRGNEAIEQKEISIVSNIQLIASMFVCLNQLQKEKVNILDFGGATGGHYKLIKQFISNEVKLNYTVCETQALVRKAMKIFASDELSFVDDIKKINIKPDIVLSSGTLQYLAEPIKVYEEFFKLEPKFIVISRFPTIENERDQLTVQHVPKDVYNGTYPCWFFSRKKWEDILNKRYEILLKWNPQNDFVYYEGEKVYQIGYVLKKLGINPQRVEP